MPTALSSAEPAQHARHVTILVGIIALLIVRGGGAAITAAWAIWNFLKKRVEAAGRAGVGVVEEQPAVVQGLARLRSMLRLSEDTLWLGKTGADLDSFAEVEKSLLQEEALDAGILTTEQVSQIDQFPPSPPPGTLPGDISVNDAPSAEDPSHVEPPSNIKPPQYDDPLSVRCADSLPPMGEYKTRIVRDGLEEHPVRVVPDAFKDLSFNAKIFYASSYGENVWSRTLIYSNGYEAAVGPDNQPLYKIEGLRFDSGGNIVSYLGIPVKDLETSGFSKSSSWEDQQANLENIKKAISRTPRSFKADLVEQERIKSEQDRYKKNQARIRKMEEGREKLQRLREDKQQAQAKDTAENKAKEEANQEERFRKLRKYRQQAQAKDAAQRKAKAESDRERERLQTLRKDRQQAQDAAEKRGKSKADLKKEEAVRKIKKPYSYTKAKEVTEKQREKQTEKPAKKVIEKPRERQTGKPKKRLAERQKKKLSNLMIPMLPSGSTSLLTCPTFHLTPLTTVMTPVLANGTHIPRIERLRLLGLKKTPSHD